MMQELNVLIQVKLLVYTLTNFHKIILHFPFDIGFYMVGLYGFYNNKTIKTKLSFYVSLSKLTKMIVK